jgi:hypothetical protein
VKKLTGEQKFQRDMTVCRKIAPSMSNEEYDQFQAGFLNYQIKHPIKPNAHRQKKAGYFGAAALSNKPERLKADTKTFMAMLKASISKRDSQLTNSVEGSENQMKLI